MYNEIVDKHLIDFEKKKVMKSIFAFYLSFNRHNHGFCMLNKPQHDMIEPSSTSQLLAGEKFSANQQCELVFGAESKVCSYMVSPFHSSNRERERVNSTSGVIQIIVIG